MSTNNRIYYACQAVGIGKLGQASFGTGNMVYGLQSVGTTTNFNLEQVFELGQLEIYENIEGLPDVEVTLEKVLDGYALIYHLCTTGVQGATASGLSSRAKERCDVRLGIYSEEFDSVGDSSSSAETEVYCSGMYLSSVSYTFNVDGNFTESVTIVGNNKKWLTSGGLLSTTAVNEFDGDHAPLAYILASGGVQRREDMIMRRCIMPATIKGVRNTGTYGNNVSPFDSGIPLAHLQNVSISTDFGREAINELGRRSPYFRPASFPIEVTCEIEALTTSGDFITALEDGDPALYGTVASGDNITNDTIYIQTRCGYGFDLGTKNKLQNVSYGGGDAGGGNVSCTYSYSNFNVLDIQHSGTLILTPLGSGAIRAGFSTQTVTW